LRAPLRYDHLSAISAITLKGQLLMQVQDHAYTSTEVVTFLRHLLRHIPGTLLIVWDGASIPSWPTESKTSWQWVVRTNPLGTAARLRARAESR
jgi:hypothetical protein